MPRGRQICCQRSFSTDRVLLPNLSVILGMLGPGPGKHEGKTQGAHPCKTHMQFVVPQSHLMHYKPHAVPVHPFAMLLISSAMLLGGRGCF